MKVALAIIGIFLSLGVSAIAFAADSPATLVLLQGRIHAQDARRSTAHAMALSGDAIIVVGPNRDVPRRSERADGCSLFRVHTTTGATVGLPLNA